MSERPIYHVKDVGTAKVMMEQEFGLLPFNHCMGPNGSHLLFYGFKRNTVIVQIFPAAGWDVYVNNSSNRVDITLEGLHALQAD